MPCPSPPLPCPPPAGQVCSPHLKDLASAQSVHVRGHEEKDPLPGGRGGASLPSVYTRIPAPPAPHGHTPSALPRQGLGRPRQGSPDSGPPRRIPCGNRTRTWPRRRDSPNARGDREPGNRQDSRQIRALSIGPGTNQRPSAPRLFSFLIGLFGGRALALRRSRLEDFGLPQKGHLPQAGRAGGCAC